MPRRALIIDDSKPVRGILGKMLRQLNFEIDEAADGRQALQCLRDGRKADIAWVDWDMPVMDGLAFVKAVREDVSLADVRLVMIATESDLVHISQAIQAGANDYITKPFTQEAIENKLAMQGLHPSRSRVSPAQEGTLRSVGTVPCESPAPKQADVSCAGKIRVLIVDDSVVVRGVVRKILSEDSELEVAGVATDGRVALDKISALHPDVVLLDIEMPHLDGLQTLRELRKSHPRLPVIMFSSLTEKGGAATVEALMLGADDYVHKPGGSRMDDAQGGQRTIRDELIPKIKQFAHRVKISSAAGSVPRRTAVRKRQPQKIEVVVIGVSTGGPNALARLLPTFVPVCPVPVLVVQHMPPVFTNHLAVRLSAEGNFTAREASEGEKADPGCVLIAPGGYHMTVAREADSVRLRMNQNPPENCCRPSVDVLFRSAAKTYGAGVLAVVLTGMGQDGLRGCRDVADAGGQIIVQDRATSVVWGMPGYVAENNLAEAILPLSDLGTEIRRRVGGKR